MHEVIAAAYEHWNSGDLEGFLALFADDALFVVPGSTRLSGEHDKAAFHRVCKELASATEEGRFRQELVCSYDGPSGSACVVDNLARMDGRETKYHTVHEWVLRDGKLQVWMLYVHEYSLFERAWQ